ncbi:DNA-directed RNA polymerase III subunit Rpc5 [Phellopilus nigrolimitatus]|nr:DNA-directed RNA polymerase III subunit Rpc5 [Phellopilus nigrolimitatus]
MSVANDDPVVSVLPIHLSTSLLPNIHLHQFPLLTRPLQIPPSAAQSGKQIRARLKPKAARLEVHVPVDIRPEVWNKERGQEYGQARATDDAEKSLESKKGKEPAADQRLSEVRMRSEQVSSRGAYMLGIVRDGHLHLHPISQTHQLRPTLTYMDVFHRKSRRSKAGADDDSDSDDGPPPDPDDPNPPAPVKKEPKSVGELKEVNVSVRKAEDKGASQSLTGGLTTARREMLHQMRDEDEEPWQEFNYCDGETGEAAEAFDTIFSKSDEKLICQSDLATFLKSIPGL